MSSYDHVFIDRDSLELFWRSLGKRATFIIRCSAADCTEAQSALETCGACALRIKPYLGYDFLIQAYKGKLGPCYDTGRTATLSLSGYAALDDDAHLLVDTLPVCEKTAAIYQLEQYRAYIEVSEADPVLMAQYAESPKAFDCDVLEQVALNFRQSIQEMSEEPLRAVCYGGPFKLLMSPDGTMLWRGQSMQIAEALYHQLIELGVDLYDPLPRAPVQTPNSFADQYDRLGAACLLSLPTHALMLHAPVKTNLHALHSCSTPFLHRLSNMLSHQQNYMVISGSDPGDPLGCCPSDDVAQANALVAAGILSCRRQDVAGESCPISLYACRGEFADQQSAEIYRDEIFRAQLLVHLNGKHSALVQVVRILLIIFVLFALAVGGLRLYSDRFSHVEPSNYQQLIQRLGVQNNTQVLLVLFREQKRCDFCLNMEAFTTAYMQEFQQQDERVLFRDVNMSDPKSQWMLGKYDFFTSTLVLFQLHNGQVVTSKTLSAAWELFNDEQRFKAMLKQEIEAIGAVP